MTDDNDRNDHDEGMMERNCAFVLQRTSDGRQQIWCFWTYVGSDLI